MTSLRRIFVGALLFALTAGITTAQIGGGRGGRGRGGAAGPRNGISGIDLGQQGQLNGPAQNIDDLLGGFRGGGNFGFGGGRRGGMGGEFMSGNEPLEPLPRDRVGVATWPVDPQFKSDLFTFVRLRFTTRSYHPGEGRGGTGFSWKNDWPNADLNLSFRLQQMTALKVNPDPIQMQIYDEHLFDYPFAFVEQVGHMQLSELEVRALRKYLLNGGFLMADDHWGLADERNWAEQMSRVFPEREPKEIGIDHPLFHCVFDIKELPQIATIQTWRRGQLSRRSPEDPVPHYRAIYDDHGRMMVLECANTDTPDAWEREGDDEDYFHTFSEKMAYPLMINILFYAMTH